MTPTSQSPRDTDRPTILSPRNVTRIASWNVRTLLETGKLYQATKEMDRYGIEILGLTETRWLESDRLPLASGHQFLYSGLPKDSDHRSGVGIILTKKAHKSLIDWKPINDRMMSARFHSKFQNITILLCYSPTNKASLEDKETFYEQLQNTFNKIHKRDIIIVMGDLNAKVGNDNKGKELIMGKEGLGEMNENGELFTDFCQMNDLVIGGTVFPHKDIHKVTWISPDQRTENQIDHITISRRWRRTMIDTRAYRGADIGSDHTLLMTKLRVKIAAVKNNGPTKKQRYDVAKLKDLQTKNHFSLTLTNKFQALSNMIGDTTEDKWNQVKQTFTETCEETIGYRKNEYKSWISQDTIGVIEKRRDIKQKLNQAKTRTQKQNLNEQYKSKNKEVKKSARKDKRDFIDKLATDAQKAADTRNMKDLYTITKQLAGRRTNTNRPVMSKEGILLSNQNDELERWREHFDELLNGTTLENLPETSEGEELEINTDPPNLLETKEAINQLKNGKAPGPDNIPPEVLKLDSHSSANILLELLKQIWETEEIPKDWKCGHIIKLPKKGDLSNCKNWRGIQLLSLPSKIFTRIILNRIRKAVDSKLREEQAGFRAGRSCIDQIATLRIIIEQSNEWQSPLFIHFIDFKKAFDMVDRKMIWKVLKHYGLPDKIIHLIQNLYDDTTCQVIHNSKLTEPFQVNTGVRQGCLLSPIIFSLIIDWVMRETTEIPRGIQWGLTSKLEDLDFADDISLLSHTWKDMQEKTTELRNTAKQVGLEINIEKSKTMRMNTKSTTPILLNGHEIENVERFTYLGSVVDGTGGSDSDIRSRLNKAKQAFAILKPLWRNKNIHQNTKIRIFNTNIKSVLLYGSETWRQTKSLEQKLQVFVNSCLRQILNIHWAEKVPNKTIWERCHQTPIAITIRKRKWNWVGHSLRRDHKNIPKKAIDWNPQGQRKRGRPPTSWRRTLEKELKEVKMSWGEAKKVAQDRPRWSAVVDALCSRGSLQE